MNNKQTIEHLMIFFVAAEKLKTTMRHSWTSDSNRQESSAEHSWMLCLIAVTIFDQMKIKFDQLKVLKILIIHDLAETIIGDIPAFDVEGRKNKKEREHAAMKSLVENLPDETRNEFQSLLEEYDEKDTVEAKIAQAIDKFESPLQHNISAIATWDQNDFDIHGLYKVNYFMFDAFLAMLREELETMTRKKITKAKQLHRFRPEIKDYYEKMNEKENGK
jgi:putative hydrolase of HD superfamily